MNKQPLPILDANRNPTGAAPAVDEKRIVRLTALGSALSDPIRVRMLSLMVAATVEGRSCCSLPDIGVPADAEEKGIGVCVCEFEEYFGMGQSKVSYHIRKLKDAGLIREEKRGKWSFYAVNTEAAQELLAETALHLGVGASSHSREAPC